MNISIEVWWTCEEMRRNFIDWVGRGRGECGEEWMMSWCGRKRGWRWARRISKEESEDCPLYPSHRQRQLIVLTLFELFRSCISPSSSSMSGSGHLSYVNSPLSMFPDIKHIECTSRQLFPTSLTSIDQISKNEIIQGQSLFKLGLHSPQCPIFYSTISLRYLCDIKSSSVKRIIVQFVVIWKVIYQIFPKYVGGFL